MRKIFFAIMIFLPLICFAQRIRIAGNISLADSSKSYRIQVGSYRNTANAERAFGSLQNAGLSPVYENYLDYKRVVLTRIDIKYLPLLLDVIYSAGFSEVWISEEAAASGITIAVSGSGAVNEITESGDKTPLAVVQTIPSFIGAGSTSGTNSYQANAPLVFFFNDKIYTGSIKDNIDVSVEGKMVDGNVVINEGANGYAVLTFTPNEPFPAGKEISVTLKKELSDGSGNQMQNDIHVSYITEQGSETSFSRDNFGFESGSSGVVFSGDGAVSTAKGDLVPFEGSYYAAASTGDRIVSDTGMAIGSTSSQIQLGPIQEAFSTLGFYYNFISAEFNEYVGSEFDDTAMVTINGPKGTYNEIITSVNRIRTDNTRLNNYTRMPDEGDSYAGHTGWQYKVIENIDVGVPAEIIFTVTDVGDSYYSSILAVDALELWTP